MNERNQFRTIMIEAIGGPLMEAIAAKDGEPGQEPASPAQAAALMADLLNRSVQMGIAMAADIDPRRSGDDGEAMRLAMTAVSSRIIAESARNAGGASGESDVKRMMSALDSLLTFADRFAPTPESLKRLGALEAGSRPLDEDQSLVQYLTALVPVVTATADYSFGRPERKMLQEAASRLADRAQILRKKLLPEGDTDSDLGLLAALSRIYAACHASEKGRLMQDGENRESGELVPLDGLWSLFEQRVAMLEVLASAFLGVEEAEEDDEEDGPAPGPQGQETNAPRGDDGAATQKIPAKIPEPAEALAMPAGKANPMSFFRKGGSAGDTENK